MPHRYLLAAALALLAGYAAHAQSPAQAPVSPAPAEGARTGNRPDVSSTAADFRPGMIVRDESGAVIGPITRVGQTAEGAPAVVVNMDGRPVNLSPNILTRDTSGDGALSSMSKAEIRSASAR